jgi:MFS transporter, PPP family, 3-phenylpropionic acid transporter
MSGQPALRPRAFALLCAHCFCAVGLLGIFLPYFALFLREGVGLSSAQAGVVMAIPPLIGLFAQPAWGHVADRSGLRVRVLVVLSAGTAVGYVALAHAHDLATTALATVLLATFQTALTPLSVSVTLASLDTPARFGRVRVWGTIGYLLIVVAVPPWLAARRAASALSVSASGSLQPELAAMFYLAAALALGAALTALGLRQSPALALRSQRGDLRALLGLPVFVRTLLFTAGGQLFMIAPMQFFPLYVRARGGSVSDVSHMWIWMLLLEVPLIFYSGGLFERIGVTRLMAAATACTGLRWIASAAAPTLAYAYPVQMLHALMVAGVGIGTTLQVERIVPPRLRSTGQALIVMVGASIGGMLSSLIGGALLERFGIDVLFLASGAGALLWALAWWRPLVADVRPVPQLSVKTSAALASDAPPLP